VGLSLKVLQKELDDEPAERLQGVREELDEATRELRELARGIHPAVLTELGLVAALRTLVRRAPLPVQLHADSEDRLPGPIEAAAYFLASEALTNVTRYANATTAAIDEALDASRVVAVDALFPLVGAQRRTLMTTPATTRAARDAAHALLAADGVPVTVIRDSTGFVAQRVVATIVNIGCDIAQKRIATPDDIDLAVTLGLGYPRGPLALGDALGAGTILTILRNMFSVLGDPRYRPSPWLARRAQLRLSLTQNDLADSNNHGDKEPA